MSLSTVDIEALREAVRRQPFQIFTLRLADGRSMRIPHSEFLAIGNRQVIVVGENDSWSVIEPILIVSLDHDGHPRV